MQFNLRKRLLLALLCGVCPYAAFATNAPSNLTASATSSSQITLSWTDNSTDEIGFTFAFDTSSALTNPTYVWAGGANTTSYTHTGLSAATTYYYKIKAEGNPDSTWTAVASATTAPAALTATAASNSSVNLTWSGNGSNAAVIGYTYAYATDSSFNTATYVWVAGNTSASATRTGLGTATTYWFKIKAEGTTDALDSPFTAAIPVTTTPNSLAATAASSSQINLSWSGNSGNPNIVGYTFAAATNSSFSGATYTYVNGAGATSVSHTGLYAGTTYYYKIKAEGTSDAYDSPYTPVVTATTSSAAPNAPSGLAATVVSSSQINLSWTDNSTNETGFELKRATDSGFTQNVVWIGGIQGTSYANTGLAASTTYYYKVRAQGATQDSAYSAAVSATTSASGDTIPAAPSGLSATAVSSTQVNLSWTDNSNNETGFEIERATDSGFTQNVVSIGGIQGATYANTGLSASTTYYYEVRAEGTAGKSAYSSAVSVTTAAGTTAHFFGINAWMPSQIGAHVYGGSLESHWADVQASGAQIVRYGGNGVDHYADPMWVDSHDSSKSTMLQYLAMADAMRGNGMEPVLQVPVYGTTYSASQAADIVRYVNVTNGRGVKYWVIGNEPDLSSTGYGTGYSASQVASYLRSFASAMKAVDPSILIIGPETAWYDTNIINGLTDCGGANDVTGADASGNYYVDILSFHTYPFSGSQTRAQVIAELAKTGGFKDNLATLQSRLSTCNSYHGRSGANALQMAVTEANVNWQNPSGETNPLTGVGAKSFLGGQFWAELLGIAMKQGVEFVTFWSVIEGNGLSYLSSDGLTKLPTYYHFQMMAQNFRGSAVSATGNQTNVKSFAAKDTDQIAVIIMNQEQSTNYNYTVRLDTGTVSGVNPLKINVDAAVAAEYNGTIASESSIVLIFNSSGTITKKIEYKLYGNADSNSPPTVTTY